MSAAIVPLEDKHLPEVREIFFESSTKKDFKDEAEKGAFFYKYLGFYLRHYPDLAWVAHEGKVLCYVVAAPVSSGEELDTIQPHLKLFAEEIDRFPAHLHINCHAESRGRGLGGKLVAKVEEELHARNIRGLHIMTGISAPNYNFYKRLGFAFEMKKDFHGSPILFMGKGL